MNPFSKLCDSADWFNPEIHRIIREELRELPRFHRKQWEFAMIFHALNQLGLLSAEKMGLSMGGGRELLLYTIAQHIKQLTVTDLYDTDTTWDCAKTDDPDAFLKQNKPFPVDDAKLKAIRMDMRDLAFDDGTFDFCYSSCAIEHIGGHGDFLRHLREAHRVLKEGGVYVFTTEFHYGTEVIEHPNNYIFPAEYLSSLIEGTGFSHEVDFDARITRHRVNYPSPANLSHMVFAGKEHLVTPILQEAPHVQLLRGKYIYTSAMFVLRKNARKVRTHLRFSGLDQSREFLESGLAEYRRLVERNAVTLDPFAYLSGGVSFYFAGHEDFFSSEKAFKRDYDTVFHSDYVWLGSGKRVLEVRMNVRERSQRCKIDLRLHSTRTASTGETETVKSVELSLLSEGTLIERIPFAADDEFCYAALAHVLDGYCVLDSAELTVQPVELAPGKSTYQAQSDNRSMWADERLINKHLPTST